MITPLADCLSLHLVPKTAKKLKQSLIEKAKLKKSYARALKREGLLSERLGQTPKVITEERPKAKREPVPESESDESEQDSGDEDGFFVGGNDREGGDDEPMERLASRAGPPPPPESESDQSEDEQPRPSSSSKTKTSKPTSRDRKEGSKPQPRAWGGQVRPRRDETTSKPRGKKDSSNPNFTTLGSERASRPDRNPAVDETTPTASSSSLGRSRKPLHTHKLIDHTKQSRADDIAERARIRELKRAAFLGSNVNTVLDGVVVHPGRTRKMASKPNTSERSQDTERPEQSRDRYKGRESAAKNTRQAHQGRQQRTQGIVPAAGNRHGRRQPNLGARMGVLLEEIQRRV